MARSRTIVLLTDFGTKDAYAASMKGVILSLYPRATLIDLSHEVEPQNILQAAFLLEAAYPYFPAGSLFVCVVDPGVGSERRILAVKTARGFFLAPDNGLLTRVLKRERSSEIRRVTNRHFFLKEISHTFHGRDCFAPTAAHLARRPSLFSKVGPKINHFVRLETPVPDVTDGRIRGEVLFFDRFGNAFTNLPKRLVQRSVDPSNCRVRVGRKTLGPIRNSYYEVAKGKTAALISSTGLLEIAVNQGSARRKLNLKEGTLVEIF